MRFMIALIALSTCFSLHAVEVPTKIEGKEIRYLLNSTSGEFSSYKDHIFETSFFVNNLYKDIDSTTGMLHDGGTYHYFKTGDDTAELHYHIESEGDWKNMHLIEKLHFTSPNHGHVEGEHVGDFMCGYSGSFTLQDAR